MWASVSHGVYISIGASGIHRSLGVKTSFVQSTTMDSWKPLHLRMMELGGNRRFREFLESHGVASTLPIREKYQTKAAAWYREALKAEAEGKPLPEPLAPGTGHLLTCEAPSKEQVMLDRIFARAPGGSDMTAGGVPIDGCCSSSSPNSRSGFRFGRAGSGSSSTSTDSGSLSPASSRSSRRCALVTVMDQSRAHIATASSVVASMLFCRLPGTTAAAALPQGDPTGAIIEEDEEEEQQESIEKTRETDRLRPMEAQRTSPESRRFPRAVAAIPLPVDDCDSVRSRSRSGSPRREPQRHPVAIAVAA